MTENYALEILKKERFYYSKKLVEVNAAKHQGYDLIELPKLCEKRLKDLNKAINKIIGGNQNEPQEIV